VGARHGDEALQPGRFRGRHAAARRREPVVPPPLVVQVGGRAARRLGDPAVVQHPVQRAIHALHAEAAEVEEQEIPAAVDGCGVLTFALPLERMAHAFARLEQLEGARRVADGMRAYPELIRGPRATDTQLMRALPGWIAKGGAEGLLCAAGHSVGVALKCEDGNGRALGPAAAAFFAQLDLDLNELSVLPLENSRKERVGEIRT